MALRIAVTAPPTVPVRAETTHLLFDLAKERLRQVGCDEALRVVETDSSIAYTDADRGEALARLAMSRDVAALPATAERWLQRALQLHPQSKTARMGLVERLMSRKAWPQADEQLVLARALPFEHGVRVQLLSAEVKRRLGDGASAQRFLQQAEVALAASTTPSAEHEAAVNAERALQLFESNDFAAALTLARNVLATPLVGRAPFVLKAKLDPIIAVQSGLDVLRGLPKAHDRAAYLSAAERSFCFALDPYPCCVPALCALAFIAAERGQWLKAEQLLQRAGSEAGMHQALAQTALGAGRWHVAKSRFAQVRMRNPDDAHLAGAQALAHIEANDFEAASQLLRSSAVRDQRGEGSLLAATRAHLFLSKAIHALRGVTSDTASGLHQMTLGFENDPSLHDAARLARSIALLTNRRPMEALRVMQPFLERRDAHPQIARLLQWISEAGVGAESFAQYVARLPERSDWDYALRDSSNPRSRSELRDVLAQSLTLAYARPLAALR